MIQETVDKLSISVLMKVLFDVPIILLLKNKWLDSYQEKITNNKVKGNFFNGVLKIKIVKVLSKKIVISIVGYADNYEIDLKTLKQSII